MVTVIAKPPILVVEGLDISTFTNVNEAAQYLEPWWVQGNEGQMYDSTGNVLLLAVDGGSVRVTGVGSSKAGDLKRAIIDSLATAKNVLDENCSLDQAVDALVAHTESQQVARPSLLKRLFGRK